MVVKRCPSCRGVGYLEIKASSCKGYRQKIVSVNPGRVLELLKAGNSNYEVARVMGVSAETVRAIGNGTWAGFRAGSR